MKKLSILTLALAAVAGSANAAKVYEDEKHAVDLYGRVYAGYVAGDKDGDSDNYGNNSYVRLGGKLKSALGNDFSAIARYEANLSIDGGESDTTVKTRLAYAGVKGDFGAVTFGRNYGALELINDWTDTSFTDPYGNKAIGIKKEDGIGRSNNVLKYQGDFSGFEVDASYKFNEDENTEDGKGDDSAFGLAAAYTFDFGLGLGAGYNVQNQGDGDDSKLAVAGINYEGHGLWAALVYADGENNPKLKVEQHTGIEAVIGYKITKAFRIQAMWNMAEGSDAGESDYDLKDQYVLGARYDFTKQFRLVGEYQINNLDGKENEFAFAARYDF